MKKNYDELLNKHRQMIRQHAWSAAQAWNMDFSELEAQALLIFVEATKRYKKTKGASFGTFLFHRLRTLNDYCEREIKIQGRLEPLLEEMFDGDSLCDSSEYISMKSTEEQLKKIDDSFVDFCDVLSDAEAKAKLSMDAQAILNYIFVGDWGTPGSALKPSLFGAQNAFKREGWLPSRTLKAWEEVKFWYRVEVA